MVHCATAGGVPVTEPSEGPVALNSVAPARDVELFSTDVSFEHVYDQHFRRLIGVLKLAGAHGYVAEEIAQEAFVRAFTRWPTVRLGRNPPGYIYRTAFRQLRRARNSRLIVTDASTFADRPSRTAEHGAQTLELIEALRSLPKRQRHCLLLTDHAGMSSKEAGAVLRISPSTVRVHTARAREVLRQRLR